jgi:hypothetical protein
MAMTSVIQEPPQLGLSSPGGFGEFVFSLASVADGLPAWGSNFRGRDFQLRKFIAKEPFFASALFTTISRYAAFGWSLEGPPRVRTRVRDMLHMTEHGKGLTTFNSKLLLDYLTQDNGGFFEIVRTEDDPAAPTVTMNVLDSARCFRTGRQEQPVDYLDINGDTHHLKWYQVKDITDMPSSQEEARGAQYCALSRLFMGAQIARDAAVYSSEKISGRRHHQIHIVNGISRTAIMDAMKQHGALADAENLTRFIEPLVIATLDPTSTVSGYSIDMASLPEGYNKDDELKWYIALIALAFGADYQDYAPLPGGNLGTAQQSEVLHLKSRGKGAALFIAIMEQLMNFHGIMPRNVYFKYGDQDIAENMEKANVQKRRAETLAILVTAQIITPEMARQALLDSGDLDPHILAMIGEQDITPEGVISSSVPRPGD